MVQLIKGELALSDPTFLERLLGKMGLVLYTFANGWDESPVSPQGYEAPVKSIGNSTTTPRDLENNLDVQIVLMALAESVAARLRKHTTNTYVASYAFNQVIDVNEIESVLFTKDTINVGEIPTEDNYYCVPLK